MTALLYKKIFDYIQSAVVIANQEKIIDTNFAFLELFGFENKSELDREQRIHNLIKAVIVSGVNKYYDSVVNNHGKTILLEINISPIREEEKVYLLEFKPIDDDSLYREITIISTYNRELFNNSPDAIVLLDNNSKIIDVNTAFSEIFGFSRFESIGRDIDDLVVGEADRVSAKELFQRVLNGEKVEITAQRVSKARKVIDVKAITYPVLIDKRISGNYVIYKDISQEKAKDKLLHEKDEFLNQLFNRSLYPIAILDKRENILDVNVKFEELFGYEREEALNKHINSLIVPQDYQSEAVSFFGKILNKETMMAKTKRKSKNGELIDVEAVGSPVIIDNHVIGFFAMYRDTRVEEQALNDLRTLVHTDVLTGLNNRKYIYEIIEKKIRNESGFTVIYFDVDQFKKVNDDFGHEVGDKLLRKIAQRLLAKRNNDDDFEIGRIGGDEFLILMSNNNTEQVEHYVKEVEEVLNEVFVINEHVIDASVSIGYSRHPYDSVNRDQLIQIADHRMYEEKKRKRILRNPVRVDPDISDIRRR